MQGMLDYLKDLCLLNGVSGDEKSIRDYIKAALKDVDCEAQTDSLGNLIVFKKGKLRPKNKIMLCAHMDEVGFIVQGINADGFISLSTVGGISDSVVYGRRICFKNNVHGVIGGEPVHFLSGEQKDKQPKLSEIYTDIGATSKEEAEKYVKLGDCAYFTSGYEELGGEFIKAKALDDRVGCAVMLDILHTELEYDTTFVFTVQEEIGTRGAGVAAFATTPDFAIILEATTACDIPGVEGEKQVCKLKHGVVVPFMDKGTAYDRALYSLAFETAAQNNIKTQTKTQVAGGNDSAAIHKSAGGVRTICLAAPCRYLHSPSSVVSKSDLQAMRALAGELMRRIAGL